MYRVLWRASAPILPHHPLIDILSQSGTLHLTPREMSHEAEVDLPALPASVGEKLCKKMEVNVPIMAGNQVFTYSVSFHGDKDFRSTITNERIIWRYANCLIK